jgi:hypothetical protein
LRHPGILLWVSARLPQDRERPDDEDAPQVAVALLGNGPQPLLAAGFGTMLERLMFCEIKRR